jgi:tRNA U34 5-methylaminomethyl-2-thiouridine-forming methyltransferase MnmC
MLKAILTSDNSHTFFNEKTGEHYHSTFGAITESEHIFINAGLDFRARKLSEINILEVGFGTGLNALLACKYAVTNNIRINYFSLEAFPIQQEEAILLNYPLLLEFSKDDFRKMHENTEDKIVINDHFTLGKKFAKLETLKLPENEFDVVFFDAFSPEVQPELWTEEIFEMIFKSMKPNGVLTTYSCKGIVKRALKFAGFKIEKIPGPPGKREFLRAVLKTKS